MDLDPLFEGAGLPWRRVRTACTRVLLLVAVCSPALFARAAVGYEQHQLAPVLRQLQPPLAAPAPPPG